MSTMLTTLEALTTAENAREDTDDAASRWKMVEQALIDWRDAEDYPASMYGTSPSPAQELAYENLTLAVQAALRTLRREREIAR